jgi:hypothetical protein
MQNGLLRRNGVGFSGAKRMNPRREQELEFPMGTKGMDFWRHVFVISSSSKQV